MLYYYCCRVCDYKITYSRFLLFLSLKPLFLWHYYFLTLSLSTSSSTASLPLSSEVLSLVSSSSLISPSSAYPPDLQTTRPTSESSPGTNSSASVRPSFFSRVFVRLARSCRSRRFGIFAPRRGLSFSRRRMWWWQTTPSLF